MAAMLPQYLLSSSNLNKQTLQRAPGVVRLLQQNLPEPDIADLQTSSAFSKFESYQAALSSLWVQV
jgi:hypothetical protein